MGVQFDPRKLYPIDDEVEHYYRTDFDRMVAEGQICVDDGDAYYATFEGYIMESPYFNIAVPPEWATHVVFIPK